MGDLSTPTPATDRGSQNSPPVQDSPNRRDAPALDSTTTLDEASRASQLSEKKIGSTLSSSSPQTALSTTLVSVTKTNGMMEQVVLQATFDAALNTITGQRGGSHWVFSGWRTDLRARHGLIIKIEDVSHINVIPWS